ncbi:MAG TPA: hypothetical protein VKY92_04515 [Verrucomicrobiae bacterium]|nr:hypothetical protein [Verrucomicrobiae bacterium]
MNGREFESALLLQKQAVIFQDLFHRSCVDRHTTTPNDLVLAKELEKLHHRALGPTAHNILLSAFQKTGDPILVELMEAKTPPS